MHLDQAMSRRARPGVVGGLTGEFIHSVKPLTVRYAHQKFRSDPVTMVYLSEGS